MGFGRIRGIFTGIVLYHRKDGKRVPRGLASALAALQDQAPAAVIVVAISMAVILLRY